MDGHGSSAARASAPRPDPVLVNALRAAHAMVRRDANGMPVVDGTRPHPMHGVWCVWPSWRRTCKGDPRRHQPPGLTLSQFMAGPVPLLWTEQIRVFNGAG